MRDRPLAGVAQPPVARRPRSHRWTPRHAELRRADAHSRDCTICSTCRRSPAGTRRPTCRPRATRPAPRRWPRWDTLLHRMRHRFGVGRPTRRVPSRAAGRTAARQPARDAPPMAPVQRAARGAGAARSAGHLALRARLAQPAAGQRLGRLVAESARGAAHRARGGRRLLSQRVGPGSLRRADGSLRARHDARPRSTAVFGERAALAAGPDPRRCRQTVAREPVVAARGPVRRWPRSAASASR